MLRATLSLALIIAVTMACVAATGDPSVSVLFSVPSAVSLPAGVDALVDAGIWSIGVQNGADEPVVASFGHSISPNISSIKNSVRHY